MSNKNDKSNSSDSAEQTLSQEGFAPYVGTTPKRGNILGRPPSEHGTNDIIGEYLMGFSEALSYIKSGHRLQRQGWNGKGMCIYLQHGSLRSRHDLNQAQIKAVEWAERERRTGKSQIEIGRRIDMINAHGDISVGWTPSQEDMLCGDWQIVG